MNINWKKAISSGIIIWGVAFVVVSVLMAIGIREGYLNWIITTIIIAITGYKLAQKMSLKNMNSALSVGLLWVIVVVLLDWLITTHFATMAFFSDYKIWVSYAIILLIPVFSMKKSTQKTNSASPPPTENPPSGDTSF